MAFIPNQMAWSSHGVWSHEQTTLALYWYYQVPFGKIHGRNPQIIEWANIINRSASALALKMANLASLDPVIQASGRKGMSNVSALDRSVWESYSHRLEQLTIDAESLLLGLKQSPEQLLPMVRSNNPEQDYYGQERQVTIRQRLRQGFFRAMILSNFNERCCISGLTEPRLLIASHIVSWAEAPDQRLNPHNGLCLSALYDRAFDQHLLTLNDHLEVMLSPALKKVAQTSHYDLGLLEAEGKAITPPARFGINPELLARHREHFREQYS